MLAPGQGISRARPPGGQASHGTGLVFTASDFPELAAGIEPGDTGEMALGTWSPARQNWKLAQNGDTVTLSLSETGGDIQPRWQKVGAWSSVPVTRSRLSSSRRQRPPRNSPRRRETSRRLLLYRPVLVIGNDAQVDIERLLELVRGRTDCSEPSPDHRRAEIRTNQQGANFQPPSSAQAWCDRATHLREQMLVALGLWPMPPRDTTQSPNLWHAQARRLHDREGGPRNHARVHLSANLYRPAKSSGRVPGLLCPHGHWSDGRVNGEVQERCIRWAKLGCVVFMYDMVGYNDSKPFTHSFLNDRLRRWGFSLTGLQTWNSIRHWTG